MGRCSVLLLLALCWAVLCAASTAGGASLEGSGEVVFLGAGEAVTVAGDATEGVSRVPVPGDVSAVAPSPRGSLLAYTTLAWTGRRLRSGLAVVDLRGGRLRWRLNDVDVFDPPAWAADGRRFAFSMGAQLWLGGASRRLLERVAVDYANHGFAWRGDGRALAYSGRQGLVVYDTRTHARTLLVRGPVAMPAWSPDGAAVAFVSHGSLFTVAALRGARRRLLAARVSGRDWSPVSAFAWSPDGKQIAYLKDGDFLLLAASAQARPRLVSRDVLDIAWSPDSRLIAFSRRAATDDATGLFVAARDGSGLRRLTSPAAPNNDRFPVWSRDGREIAYQRAARGDAARLYIVGRDGSDARPVGGDDLSAETASPRFAWLASTVSLPPPEPLLPLRPTAEITAGSTIAGIAVDGTEVAALLNWYIGEGYSSWESRLWSPISGQQSGATIRCVPNQDATPENPTYDDIDGPALAGTRYGYVCSAELDDTLLFTATVDQPHPAAPVLDETDGSPVNLAGGGNLLVATVHNDLVRIGCDGTVTVLRHYPHPIELIDVNQDRALIRVDASTLEIITADGETAATLPVPTNTGAMLRGARLYTFLDGTLTEDDLNGQTLLQRPLPSDALLSDISGDLALYTIHSRLHLHQISDGRDIALELPGQTSYPWAGFTSDGGLVVGYNTPTTKPAVLDYLAPDATQALLTHPPEPSPAPSGGTGVREVR